VSLERRKIYVAILDPEASHHGRIRVVDESGYDYLYLEGRFIEAELPQATRRAVLQAAQRRSCHSRCVCAEPGYGWGSGP